METLHLNSIQHSLFLLAFLIQFSSSPQFSSLGYVPQNKYFINCGSDTDVTANNHTYIGESKSGYPKTSFSSSNKENTLSSSVPSSTLYQTARVFQSPSWYEFSTVANGTYLSTHMTSQQITEDAVYLCPGNPLPRDIEQISYRLLNEQFADSFKRINEMKTGKGLALVDIVREVTMFVFKIKMPPAV